MKGFGNIMKEAQKLQAQMEQLQAEAGNKKVEATAGGGMVTVEANGRQEIVSIKIDREVINPDDAQMLEDLVIAACNEALRKSRELVQSVARLIEALQRLPGIGPKTAQRLSFFLLKRPVDEVAALAESLTQLKALIIHCSVCFNVTQEDPCRICRDPQRDVRSLCIVEEPNDLLALEKTGGFRGRYHVLLGALSPLDGIGPEDLKVRELLSRLEAASVEEIILATNPSVEGEATAIYLAKLLKPFAPKITRLARGLPVGGDLEYADEVTLAKALEGRRDM